MPEAVNKGVDLLVETTEALRIFVPKKDGLRCLGVG
jgi:hypothetical protein